MILAWARVLSVADLLGLGEGWPGRRMGGCSAKGAHDTRAPKALIGRIQEPKSVDKIIVQKIVPSDSAR